RAAGGARPGRAAARGDGLGGGGAGHPGTRGRGRPGVGRGGGPAGRAGARGELAARLRRDGRGPGGDDDVELRLLAHPGAPSLPLQKGASGGELSRVMLAIEVVFAGAGGPPTLVFDEVDAGVGGRAAVEIGRRLARLARDHQVFVVTHLPQVAAFADRHLVGAKDPGGAVRTSGGGLGEGTGGG